MVRIAHFTDAAADGVNGIATSIRLLRTELARRGHQSLVLTTSPLWGGRAGDAIGVRSAPAGMGDFRFALLPLRAMRSRVRTWQPDLVHVHTPGPLGAAGLTLARELDVPAVYTYHTDMHAYSAFYHFPAPVIRAGTALYARHLPRGEPVTRRGVYGAVEAANARVFESARVIVLPTANALRHCGTAAAYAAKTRVVATPPGHPGEETVFPREPVVLFVGRISAEKGIPLLLDAFALLRRARPETTLVLVGPLGRGVRRPLRKHRHKGVRVTGALAGAGVRAAYRRASVFAFPSTTDTQGIVLHEAACAGLPIVMVDRELAAGHPLGGAARVADPDPASLAAALRAAIDYPGDRGRRARELAAGLTVERFGDRMLGVYREALGSDILTNGGRG